MRRTDTNTRPVALTLPVNEVRLLLASVLDRKIMVAADRAEGRWNLPDFELVWEALTTLEGKLRSAAQ
jgi:hypothetical protein